MFIVFYQIPHARASRAKQSAGFFHGLLIPASESDKVTAS
jgi:hypothetical protein